MAWIDDFTINSTLKTVRHTSGTTVYSVNVQYSAIKDWEDDPANMTHEVVMTAQTPTEYSMVNGWFIDNVSTQFLNGGAITTIGYLNEIQRVVTTNAGTDPIASDIGKQVNDGGDVGALLHYDLDINDDGTQVNAWYVRTGSGTALTGALTITSGTGAQTVSTSVDGEEIWTNVYSFGVLGATVNPQFYVEQVLNGADHRLIEWVANSNFSRGNMDVLIRTQVEGATNGLDNLLITIRQPHTTYDTSEQTLNGGRNPFALNSADDPDNNATEWYVLFDGETGTDFLVDDTITADSKAWYATISEVGYFTDTATGYLGLVGLNESIDAVADNDAFTGSGGGTAVINGTPGDKLIGYDAESVAMTTIGQIVTGGTSGAKSRLVGIDDNGTTGYLCLSNDINNGGTIDFREDSTYYDVYTNDETITGSTEGSLTVDLTGGSSPLDLQLATAGLKGKIEFIFTHGYIDVAGGHSLTAGMHVTATGSGSTGTITHVDGNRIYIGNTDADFANADVIDDDDSAGTGTANSAWTDQHTVTKAFQQATNKNYDLIVFMESETVQRGYEFGKFLTGDGNKYQFEMYELDTAALVRAPVDGQFYLSAYRDNDTPANTYDKVGKRAAPLGNFAGGTWFTARGIWLEDVAGADAIKFQLIDSDNVTQNPPNFVQIQTTNNAVSDQQGVYEDDGTGLVKKDTYTSHATNNGIGTNDWDTNGTPAIRLDSPSEGWVIVVDTSSTSGQAREHAYYYTSFSGDIFTTRVISDSTGTAGAGGLTHTNSGRNFTTDGVLPGMMCRNTTDGSIGIIDTVGTTTFTVKFLEGGAENDFDTSDVVEINKNVVTYDGTDKAFVPYISENNASGTTTEVTVIYVTNRPLLSVTRQKGVIFATEAAATLTSTGATIPVVRTTDTIAT